jgi:NAD(P)-dependent dehydrogenase (short-subunit alcohol dehydrogenase family)
LFVAGLGLRAFVRARRYICLGGRTVLITGGSRDLGLTLARLCADQHANVVICARDAAEVDRAKEELQARGANILAVQCDITIQSQVDELVRMTVAHFGSLDILINNAGVIQVGPSEEMTIADYDEAIKTHFAGPLYTTLAALAAMRGRGGGRIVNITSIGGKTPAPHLLPYTASKYALVGFSEGLRTELIKDKIYVTTVAPGLFRSGSQRRAYFKGENRKEYAWFATASNLPLISMSPERLARRVLNAMQHGQAELITPLAASLQARLFGLFPGLSSEVAAMINWFLPSPGGIGRQRATGAQSYSYETPQFAQKRVDETGQYHNEIG